MSSLIESVARKSVLQAQRAAGPGERELPGAAQAEFVVCDSTIERVHQTLKQGLLAERLQIDDFHSLRNALALYYLVAWRWLYLTQVARDTPEAPASTVCTAEEGEVLSRAVGRKLCTVREVVRAMAKVGGWEDYPSCGEPGVLAVWRGLRELQSMVRGYRLAALPGTYHSQSYDTS